MKTLPILSACAALVTAGVMTAQIPSSFAEQVALRIIQTDDPEFPLTLRNSPVVNGEARIAINVDVDGKLVECLVTGYSRKEFADSAVAALHRWKYEPARLNGQPWPSVQELSFDFTRTGVVISMTGMDMLTNRLEDLLQNKYAFRSHSLRELDRIPTPIEVISPVAPPLDPRDGKRSIVVDFYIDQDGRVRMPAVKRAEANDLYAASAMAAVRLWKFEPPTVDGRPVLVHAQQQFDFVPKT
ncbi:MAG TPA: TonB family protein [Lacunisphaera sp.]|nr:TonB family protein [Lacunisphaera sp.]